MRTLLISSVTFCFAVALAAAEEQKKPQAGAAPATLAQKTCPVSGKPVAKDAFTEYKGLKVYFCCPDCIDKFKDDPGKYLPAVYRQIYPQTVQVKCPVMGEAVDGKTFAEYKGTKVGLCCSMCVSRFNAEPAKYMAKLKECSTSQVRCPVLGKPINPAASTEHDGKTIYFCCKGCVAKFKADPAKYADKLRPEAGVLACGATAADDLVLCPTCAAGGGGQHSRKQAKTLVHEGKTYFFCCEECATKFKADPGKYVKALDAEMKKLTPRTDEKSPAKTGGEGKP